MGRIQSIQSFSTVDGPGTRCVVFFQGCPVGCIFCHNPDSWEMRGGEEIEVENLMRRLERFRSFLQKPGLTISQLLTNWRRLASLPVPVWLRYVLINKWTDDPDALRALGQLAREQPNLEKVEILPFNSLAENKWEKLGWKSPLFQGKKPIVGEEQIRRAEEVVERYRKASVDHLL